jgi:hypothetical protein
MIGNGSFGNGTTLPTSTLHQLLSVNGDGTGATSMNVNGSVTSVKFEIQPPSDKIYQLRRMNTEILAANFNSAALYGALTLANGMRIYIENDSGIIKEYTNGFTIKRNHDWSLLAGVDSVISGGAGTDALNIRWTFPNGGSEMILNGANNERLVLEVQDDQTGLVDQLSQIQGNIKSI